ncbi:MAG: proton-conducting transporter membrane subunit [Planctomycetota bacterium]
MQESFAWLVLTGPLALIAGGLLPDRWVNRHAATMGRTTQGIILITLTAMTLAVIAIWKNGAIHVTVSPALGPAALGVCFDSLSATLSLLVCFIGLVTARYARSYLEGDAAQGRFFRWMNFTLGAVLCLVVASNLAMFLVAWIMTSLGLHQLLVHYRERRSALLAARKKFLISRLGDLFLILALALSYTTFGSLEYRDLFRAAEVASQQPWNVHCIAILLVLGAMTKSAQFPVHSWLPDTMETPTPVSALMHAGIINAGGYLVIRLSPVVSLSSISLDLLALVGAFTALFAAVIKLTQTSVKRSLAYSTISQMGFMMFQCGVGAFPAALLHIVAHSLYKAHAFLRSGSAIEQSAKAKVTPRNMPTADWSFASYVLGSLIACALCISLFWAMGITIAQKPGGFALAFILTMALAQLLARSFESQDRVTAMRGMIVATCLFFSYVGAYFLFEQIMTRSLSANSSVVSPRHDWLICIVGAAFLVTFTLQITVTRFRHLPLSKWLYVHASNGFYVDLLARKLVVRVWGNH